MNRVILFLLFISFHTISNLNATPILYGWVKDEKTGEALTQADIKIKGTKLYTTTDEDGYFFLDQIPNGKRILSVSIVGYQNKEINIEISNKDSIELKIFLTPKIFIGQDIVVSATRKEYNLLNVPSSVKFITHQDIQKSSANNASEILDDVSGVYIKDQGGAGLKTLSIRGTNSEHILVLLDNQQLNSSQNGLTDLSLISLDNIERIEVYKGGISALYGSQAIGGVVNLISKSGRNLKGFKVNAKTSKGSFGYNAYKLYLKQKIHKFNYDLSFTRNSSKNYRYKDVIIDYNKYIYEYTGTKREHFNSDMMTEAIFLQSGYEIDSSSYINFNSQFTKSNRGIPGTSLNNNLFSRQEDTESNYNIAIDKELSKALKFKIQSNYRYTNQKYKDPTYYIYSQHKNYSSGLSFQLDWSMNNLSSLIIGSDCKQNRISSTNLSNTNKEKITRNEYSFFAMDNIKVFPSLFIFKRADLFISSRLDKYTDMKSVISPHFGINFGNISNPQFSIRSTFGKNFRTPTFNELYWSDPFSKGNINIQPEYSTNYDIGLIYEYEIKSENLLKGEITYFNIDTKNLISWQVENGIWSPFNTSQSNSQGIEAETEISLFADFVKLNINYTYNNVINKSNNDEIYGKRLPYKPQNLIKCNASLNYKWASINLSYRFVDMCYSTPLNEIQSILPSYNVTDLSLFANYEIHDTELSFKLEVLNLFDATYQVIRNYPIPERNFRITLGIGY